jgi:adenosine deaminase
MDAKLYKKVLLHIHMEVTRRLDRLRGANSGTVIPPAKFYLPYGGILDRHRDMHDEELLSYLVYELLSEAGNCGVIYTEFKYNLLRWLDAGLKVEEVYRALNNGMRKAYEETGIYSNAILCIRRDFKPGVVERLVSIVCETKMPQLVAIDLAGDERKYPRCDDFKYAFLFAKKSGLKVTVHAGEYGGPENIWFALENLGADRIGHGISSIEDPVLLNYLSTEKVMLEVALSSNKWAGIIEKYEYHPASLFIDEGVPISLNTDNPMLLTTDMNKEFELARKFCNLSDDSLHTITRDSVIYSFADADTKETLLQKVDSYGMAHHEETYPVTARVSKDSIVGTSDTAMVTMDSYDRNAFGYAGHYYGKNIMKNQIEEFLSYLPSSGPVLDAGCGPGHDSNYINSKGYEVIGIDFSKGMIEEARKRVKGVEFLERNMCQPWPEKERYFGGIWCCAALLHLTTEEADLALSSFHDLLQANGVMFISVMRGQGASINTEERPYGSMKRYFKRYEVNDLTEVLTTNKFEVIKLTEEARWVSCLARKI